MKQTFFFVLAAAAFTSLIFFRPPTAEAQAPNAKDYLVGAVYYVWYPGNFDDGWLRRRLAPRQLPVLGIYDSRDPEVAEQHIAWASEFGIDFLALDWWPRRPEQNSAISEVFLQAENLGDIKFCIFYETWDLVYDYPSGASYLNADLAQVLVQDIMEVGERFFSHPNYLKIGDRPVIFFYLSRTLSGEVEAAFTRLRQEFAARGIDPYFIGDEVFWKVSDVNAPKATTQPQAERIRLFDAVTSYNMYESQFRHHSGYGSQTSFIPDVKKLYDAYLGVCGDEVDFVPNVIPGFNDRGGRHIDNHYVIPRQWGPGDQAGSFFSQFISQVGLPYLDPDLNMLLVTSFNEWNEDTAIEPLDISPPTKTDDSQSGHDFTWGYSYAGYGTTYLQVLRGQMCALHGHVLDRDGQPVWKAKVCAWQDGEAASCGLTDREGKYTLSRGSLPGGEYQVDVDSWNSPHGISLTGEPPSKQVDFRAAR